jgi:hypothetical protein
VDEDPYLENPVEAIEISRCEIISTQRPERSAQSIGSGFLLLPPLDPGNTGLECRYGRRLVLDDSLLFLNGLDEDGYELRVCSASDKSGLERVLNWAALW